MGRARPSNRQDSPRPLLGEFERDVPFEARHNTAVQFTRNLSRLMRQLRRNFRVNEKRRVDLYRFIDRLFGFRSPVFPTDFNVTSRSERCSGKQSIVMTFQTLRKFDCSVIMHDIFWTIHLVHSVGQSKVFPPLSIPTNGRIGSERRRIPNRTSPAHAQRRRDANTTPEKRSEL
jgi:hypothetical protein